MSYGREYLADNAYEIEQAQRNGKICALERQTMRCMDYG